MAEFLGFDSVFSINDPRTLILLFLASLDKKEVVSSFKFSANGLEFMVYPVENNSGKTTKSGLSSLILSTKDSTLSKFLFLSSHSMSNCKRATFITKSKIYHLYKYFENSEKQYR